jgi:hypothetical protein
MKPTARKFGLALFLHREKVHQLLPGLHRCTKAANRSRWGDSFYAAVTVP